MKESINEHDMTKKMMEVMRGGFKPLLTEFVKSTPTDGRDKGVLSNYNDPEQPQQSQTDNPEVDQPNPEERGLAKAPNEGRESLIQLDGSYFEMAKNDQRFTTFVDSLKSVVPTATVTSIYISKFGGLVANGYALKYSENSGLFFTLSIAEDSILVSSENVQGKIGTEVQTALQKFQDNLRADDNVKQYLYDEKIDKQASDATEQD